MNPPNKEFELKENELLVTVTQADDVELPSEDGTKTKIGTFEQTTLQHIDKDKVQTLLEFIESQKETMAKNIENLEKAYDKVKHVDILDEKLVEAVMKYQNKNKEFKTKVQALNDHIALMQQKKQIEDNLNFLRPQFDAGNEELDKLKKALA